MQAIILAAGQGTRLRPLTNTIPKPLLPIDNISILELILESLPTQITEVIIVVLEKDINLFKKVLEKKSFSQMNILIIPQGTQMLGTLGALYSAKAYIHTYPFLVLGGDDLQDKHALEKMVQKERAFGIHYQKLPSKIYYHIECENGYAHKMTHPDPFDENKIYAIATGIYILGEDIWDQTPVHVKGDEYGLPQTLLPLLVGTKLYHAIDMPEWFQINTIPEYEEAIKRITTRSSEQ